jgi:hypothetical protein
MASNSRRYLTMKSPISGTSAVRKFDAGPDRNCLNLPDPQTEYFCTALLLSARCYFSLLPVVNNDPAPEWRRCLAGAPCPAES